MRLQLTGQRGERSTSVSLLSVSQGISFLLWFVFLFGLCLVGIDVEDFYLLLEIRAVRCTSRGLKRSVLLVQSIAQRERDRPCACWL